MTLPPFPDIKEQSDYELGGLLLGYFIATQADKLGIPPDQIPEEFAELVRQHVLTLESKTAKNAAVEKALHKAAGGDFETAGKLLREYMLSGAVAFRFVPIGVNYSKAQSDRAKNPRGKVGDDDETIGEIIGWLALRRAHGELTAKELFPHFFSELEERKLDPCEDENREDWKKSIVSYDFKDGRKSITGGQFANVVSVYRTSKKSG